MADYEFDWDEANRGHIARHNVTPEEVEQMFNRPLVDEPTNPGPDGEERNSVQATSAAGRFLTLFTPSAQKCDARSQPTT